LWLKLQTVLELHVFRRVVFLVQSSGEGHSFEPQRRFGLGDFGRVSRLYLRILSQNSSPTLGVVTHRGELEGVLLESEFLASL